MELTQNNYIILIFGVSLHVPRKRFLTRYREIELPLSFQYHSDFIYDLNNKVILKNRYAFSSDLTSTILNDCLNSSINYLDFFDKYNIDSITSLVLFLRECKSKRVVTND